MKTNKEKVSFPVSRKFDLNYSHLLLGIICITRISNGMLMSILGPTLLSLANNVGTGVAEVSYIFTALNCGILIGGSSVAYIRDKINRIYSFGITYALMAGCLAVIPLTTTLWTLLLVGALSGIVYGYLDVGVQAMILQVWGEKGSRPHIAAYHFLISIGGSLTPLIVRPFLADSNSEDSTCPNNDADNGTDNFNTTDIYQNLTSTPPYESGKYDPVIYAYAICSAYTFLSAIMFAGLGVFKIETKVRHVQESQMEAREEDPFKKIFPLLLLTCIYYFLCLSSEALFGSYVFAVGVCSELQMKPADAAILNTLFWVGYGVARLSLVFVSRLITPRPIVIAATLGCTTTLVLELIWGKDIVWTACLVSFIFGFFVSLLYPGGITWISQYTNMSGRYTSTFCTGAALGAMIMLPIGGIVFEIEPFYVMYLDLATTVVLLITFGAMVFVQRKLFGVKKPSKICPPKEIYDNKSYEEHDNDKIAKI